MLKRVCAIVVIVLGYNPVLYQVSMRERFVFPHKQALHGGVWIIFKEIVRWFVFTPDTYALKLGT